MAATFRIKGLTRVAEKVSFRLVESLFKEIQDAARDVAFRRANSAGLALTEYVSSEESMQNDFMQAEDGLVRSLMNKQLHLEPKKLAINDILGFKVVATQQKLEAVQQIFLVLRRLMWNS